MAGKKKKIGVLALQGAYREHFNSLIQLDCQVELIKQTQQLSELAGLIIPGGESTAIRKLMIDYNFIDSIIEQNARGMGIWGTCAGLILLARKIKGEHLKNLELIDIQVERNAYGRQINSFVSKLSIPVLGDNPFPAVFIRAPKIIHTGKKVKMLARYQGHVVLAREQQVLVSSFHPELTADLRLHQYFLNILE